MKEGLVIIVVCSHDIWGKHYKRLAEKSLDTYFHLHTGAAQTELDGIAPDKIVLHTPHTDSGLFDKIRNRATQYNAKIYEERYV